MDDIAKIFISDYKSIILTLFFIVPGFVFFFIYSLFGWKQSKTEDNVVLFLKCFTVSCLNLGFWIVALYNSTPQPPSAAAAVDLSAMGKILFEALYVSPAVAAIVLGLVNLAVFEYGWLRPLRSFLGKLGWFKIEPIPTGWDWKFYQQDEGVFVLVSLNDGNSVAGYFGDRSLASDRPGERDLFVKAVFEVPRNGPWIRRDRTDGILIKG